MVSSYRHSQDEDQRKRKAWDVEWLGVEDKSLNKVPSEPE